jgi:hypothetical protein
MMLPLAVTLPRVKEHAQAMFVKNPPSPESLQIIANLCRLPRRKMVMTPDKLERLHRVCGYLGALGVKEIAITWRDKPAAAYYCDNGATDRATVALLPGGFGLCDVAGMAEFFGVRVE